MSRIYNQLIQDDESERVMPPPPPRMRPHLKLVPLPPPPNARMMAPYFKKRLWRRNALTVLGVLIAAAGLVRAYHSAHPVSHSDPIAKLRSLDRSPAVLKVNEMAIDQKEALTLFQKQDYLAAKTQLEKLVETYPRSVELMNDLAMSYFKLNEMERAKKTWMRAVKINPNDASMLNNFGSFFIAQKEWQQAILLLTKALDQDPDLLEARLNLAIALESSGKPMDAVSEYEIYLANPKALPTLRVLLQKRIEKIKSFANYYEEDAAKDEDEEPAE